VILEAKLRQRQEVRPVNAPAINPSNMPAAVAAWVNSFGPLPPFAVNVSETRKVLGGKARSAVYDEIGLGNLDAVKDGGKTLITVESIIRYCSRMQPAQIKPPKPKTPWPKPAAKQGSSRSRQIAQAAIASRPKRNATAGKAA
jgi:hypothetical protein